MTTSGDRHAKKMHWLDENESMLEAKYPGMWVAISDEGLAGVGQSSEEAVEQASKNGFSDVLIAGVKRVEYQGKILIRRWI
jgi:hypothetical protein